jgi:hypothetical protein
MFSSSILFDSDEDIIPIEDVKELDTLLIELDSDDDNVKILLSTDSDNEFIELDKELES